MNPFKVLGIEPPRLNLDLEALEKIFYQASLKNHPDKNPDLESATKNSAETNQAYRMLRDIWTRAQYVVEAAGLSLNSKMPPSLAELFFELKESKDQDAINALQGRLRTEANEREQKLKVDFINFDQASSDVERMKVLESLKLLLIEHKYASSMARDLEAQ